MVGFYGMYFHVILCLALTNADPGKQWSLPRIDILPLIQKDTDPEKLEVTISQLQRAAAEVGFFSIVNHGVSGQLIEDIHDAAIHFFDKPGATKMRFALQEYNPESPTRYRGFWPREVFGKECLAFSNPSWRTPKSNMACHETNHRELFDSVFGTEWMMTVENYFNTMLGLGKILFDAMTNSTSVALDRDSSISTLRFNHYPERYADEKPVHFGRDGKALALEEHVDNILLTILSQDDVGGLELLGMDNV